MKKGLGISILALFALTACEQAAEKRSIEIYQTSAAGDKLTKKSLVEADAEFHITIDPNDRFQTITGFGGAFTESTSHLLQKLSDSSREHILQRYFGDTGARYSLTRTHINSCDFSLTNYAYVEPGDTALQTFDIAPDRDDIIPTIKQAQAISGQGFKIIASPWTAPPFMKDNGQWEGGKLRPEFYPTWAQYFEKYLDAYKKEGIPIWGITVENEPLGNDANWESMHYTPQEMAHFVKEHLGPTLAKTHADLKILVYDQNKGHELELWAEQLLTDTALLPHIYGTAVHWYTGTKKWFPASLQKTHQLAPQKHIIATEACVDAEVPHWRDDDWYWRDEATDWGYTWAPEKDKADHPKYVPVYRYARDIIGSLNNWVEGWIDWNMVLDKQGGPNWAENWCVAPVIVDTLSDETYFTPLYYTLSHFSRFIRPGDVRIGLNFQQQEAFMATATQNSEGQVVVTALNMADKKQTFTLSLHGRNYTAQADARALTSIILK